MKPFLMEDKSPEASKVFHVQCLAFDFKNYQICQNIKDQMTKNGAEGKENRNRFKSDTYIGVKNYI